MCVPSILSECVHTLYIYCNRHATFLFSGNLHFPHLSTSRMWRAGKGSKRCVCVLSFQLLFAFNMGIIVQHFCAKRVLFAQVGCCCHSPLCLYGCRKCCSSVHPVYPNQAPCPLKRNAFFYEQTLDLSFSLSLPVLLSRDPCVNVFHYSSVCINLWACYAKCSMLLVKRANHINTNTHMHTINNDTGAHNTHLVSGAIFRKSYLGLYLTPNHNPYIHYMAIDKTIHFHTHTHIHTHLNICNRAGRHTAMPQKEWRCRLRRGLSENKNAHTHTQRKTKHSQPRNSTDDGGRDVPRVYFHYLLIAH